jgi:hypothetical protein
MRKRDPKVQRSKVFAIGLSRTGTTSLNEAVEILGFSAIHYPPSLQEIELYDAATDLPVADAFERLDARFPGSKFIYTVRERAGWLESCRRHWLRRQEKTDELNRELRRRLYGTTDFDPDQFTQAYDRHEKRVLSYFAQRPHDLLVLDICAGHADWETLCSFLGVPVPDVPFPHTNRLDSLDNLLARLLHVIGDAEQVAKIAKVSVQYVEDLRGSAAFRNHDKETPLSCDRHPRIDRVLTRACSYFATIDFAAAQLKLPRTELAAARARRQRQKRAKFFRAVKRKLHWLVTRTATLLILLSVLPR